MSGTGPKLRAILFPKRVIRVQGHERTLPAVKPLYGCYDVPFVSWTFYFLDPEKSAQPLLGTQFLLIGEKGPLQAVQILNNGSLLSLNRMPFSQKNEKSYPKNAVSSTQAIGKSACLSR